MVQALHLNVHRTDIFLLFIRHWTITPISMILRRDMIFPHSPAFYSCPAGIFSSRSLCSCLHHLLPLIHSTAAVLEWFVVAFPVLDALCNVGLDCSCSLAHSSQNDCWVLELIVCTSTISFVVQQCNAIMHCFEGFRCESGQEESGMVAEIHEPRSHTNVTFKQVIQPRHLSSAVSCESIACSLHFPSHGFDHQVWGWFWAVACVTLHCFALLVQLFSWDEKQRFWLSCELGFASSNMIMVGKQCWARTPFTSKWCKVSISPFAKTINIVLRLPKDSSQCPNWTHCWHNTSHHCKHFCCHSFTFAFDKVMTFDNSLDKSWLGMRATVRQNFASASIISTAHSSKQ